MDARWWSTGTVPWTTSTGGDETKGRDEATGTLKLGGSDAAGADGALDRMPASEGSAAGARPTIAGDGAFRPVQETSEQLAETAGRALLGRADGT